MKKHTDEAFLRRVMEFVVEQNESEAVDRGLRAQCEEMIQRARTYGLSTELEVASFAVCGFAYGADFDANPNLPFRQLLTNPALDAAAKAERMVTIFEGSSERTEADAREFS